MGFDSEPNISFLVCTHGWMTSLIPDWMVAGKNRSASNHVDEEEQIRSENAMVKHGWIDAD